MATSQNEDENKVLDGSLDENVLHVERTSSVNIQLSIHIDFFLSISLFYFFNIGCWRSFGRFFQTEIV